jgi:hypothetical protein
MRPGNMIIGTLETDGPGEVFLLMSEVLESINYSTICKLFDKVSVSSVATMGILHFVTDWALYNLKSDV